MVSFLVTLEFQFLVEIWKNLKLTSCLSRMTVFLVFKDIRDNTEKTNG